MKKKICAGLMLGLLGALCGMTGCGRKTAEVIVPQATVQEQPEVTESAELALEIQVGTILGEEEVVLMLEGESEAAVYTRIQGNGEFSVAYDPEDFSVLAEEAELCFTALDFGKDCTTPVCISFRKAESDSAEELAEQFVAESDEECTIEEVTVGEGEYPAFWVNYAEGTDMGSRICDIYVLRLNQQLYVIQMDGFVGNDRSLEGTQHTILSTLRFHEG